MLPARETTIGSMGAAKGAQLQAANNPPIAARLSQQANASSAVSAAALRLNRGGLECRRAFLFMVVFSFAPPDCPPRKTRGVLTHAPHRHWYALNERFQHARVRACFKLSFIEVTSFVRTAAEDADCFVFVLHRFLPDAADSSATGGESREPGSDREIREPRESLKCPRSRVS